MVSFYKLKFMLPLQITFILFI